MILVVALLVVFLITQAIIKKQRSRATYADKEEFLNAKASLALNRLLNEMDRIKREDAPERYRIPMSVEKLSERNTEIFDHLKHEYISAQVEILEYQSHGRKIVPPEEKAELIYKLSLCMENSDLSDRIMRLLTK